MERARCRSLAKSIMLVGTLTVGMILNISCSSSASITLPSIGRDFGVDEDKLQWVVSAYSLSSGCLLIFFGRLADLYGRKKAFLIGCLWLGIFSLGCGFANNINTLYILRGLQGVGPAAVVPASLGILAHAFPPSRARTYAFATFSAGAPVGGAVGLQIGGILTQWAPATWRAPFYLSAGLAALVFIGGVFYIDKDVPSTETDRRVDWLGAALVTSALVLITFVLGEGEQAPQRWRTPYIIALLIIGVLLLAAFIAWEGYLERDQTGKRCPPLMKLSMWTRANGKFAATQIIAFLEWASFLAWQFWAQLFYQDYQHLDPVLTSIRLLPMFVVGIACNVFVAAVVGRIPLVVLTVAGTLLTSTAGLLFALIDPNAPYWAFGFPAAILSVFGADFVFACGTIFVAKISLPHEQSLAGGLFQTLTQLGTALGLATTTIVHNTVLRDNVQEPIVDAELEAYKAAQWMTFGFGAAGAVIALLFLRGVGPVGNRKPMKGPEPVSENGETRA
ncbi:MFS general substrate transporter [Fomitiporia mediterranea MF3/22]|uniref:MFS general substrate transporter n=1 Tax=Fomitiporia mediterranea (strain MF3/22) TaxID=694068 RepID=UPI0004408CF1|nr:MFS general substrate transporter [Fomitiporia mediterranea MF3/22]EJD06323.1 MFS general substrate transporter [Fomitiporia mediterranea MF3/22]